MTSAPTSIRSALTRRLVITIVPLTLAVGVGLFAFVRASLVARFDDGLLARARALAGAVRLDGGEIALDFADKAMPQFERADGSEVFEVRAIEAGGGGGGGGGTAGRTIDRSDSLGAFHVESRVPAAGATAGSTAGSTAATLVWDLVLPRVGGARALAMRFTPEPDEDAPPDVARGTPASLSPGPEILITVAMSRGDLDRTLALLAGSLAGGAAVLVLGVLVLVRAGVGRGLAPIAELASQMTTIGPDNLGARLAVRLAADGVPIELAPIAARTNEMLARLAEGFEREKQLAASAAHELRTPIAEIRAATEIALSRDRTADEHRRTLTTVLGAAVRMGEAADAVLRLSRVQAGRERPVLRSVTLDGALRRAFDRWSAALAERGVSLDLAAPPACEVLADPDMLGVILDNLAANAAEQTPGGGAIAARCVRDDAGWTMTLTNTAVGAVAGEAADANAGRGGAPGAEPASVHAGLGLRIATAMTDVCGGRLTTRRDGDRFVAVVVLPAASGVPC